MRKIIISIVGLMIIAFIGSVYLLPSYISNQIGNKIGQKIEASEITANVDTSPMFMLLFGQVDKLDIQAKDISLDKVKLNELIVTGNDIDVSIEDLLLAKRLVIKSAKDLQIKGIINEENLSTLLNEKVDKVSDIIVTINQDDIEATGKISFLGNVADVHVKGYIFLQERDLIFRITDVDTTNSLFGKIGLKFTKDIVVVKADTLPIEGAMFTDVQQQNGQILVEASVNK